MTEAEWMASEDPELMLRHLGFRLTDRQAWLFTAACIRRLFPWFHLVMEHNGHLKREEDVQLWAAMDRKRYLELQADVQLYEAAADRTAPEEVMAQMHPPGGQPCFWVDAKNGAAHWAEEVAKGMLFRRRYRHRTAERLAAAAAAAKTQAVKQERAFQADMLRCIVGNPFLAVAIDQGCLAWQDGTVVRLAQAIYDDRAFDQLPILADALEEAACTDEWILSHLRFPGSHVRGCVAVDVLLGKS